MEDSKKQQIMESCLAEFAEYGYEKANTNQICESAGVSKGLLFHYYGSKKKLYLACVEKCVSDFMGIFQGFSVEQLPFIEAVRAYGTAKLRFYALHPLHYKVMINAFFQMPKELQAELSKRYAEMYRYSIEVLNELVGRLRLKPGVTKEQAITLLLAAAGVMENKYLPAIMKTQQCDEAFYDRVESEYLQLIYLILYGVAEPPQ